MELVIKIVAVIIVLLLLYLYMIKPARKPRSKDFTPFTTHFFAHRGLFDNKEVPENSLAAFEAAMEEGYGIELDLQMTKDEKVVVFHDKKMKRLLEMDKCVSDYTYEEITSHCILNSEEKVPLFSEVLELVHGEVPMIVEFKATKNKRMMLEQAAKMLDDYEGDYCVEAFNPFILRWFKDNRPEVIRGQLASDSFKDERKANIFKKIIMSNLLMNYISKPHFIAYDHRFPEQISYRICKKLYNPMNVAWTVTSQTQVEQERGIFDIFIFEGFEPKDQGYWKMFREKNNDEESTIDVISEEAMATDTVEETEKPEETETEAADTENDVTEDSETAEE